MPRQARLDAPGVFHHVMIRGIEGRKIFLSLKDREDFLERLNRLVPETETRCFGWAFLSNHAHFLFQTGKVPLSTFMRRLLTGYAIGFNRRNNRQGQLFQNRFKSIVCQEDAYLKELVRYIHLNPVRAGMVSDLERLNKYRYCGHSALAGRINRDWQSVGYVLGYFGRTVRSATKAYLAYIEKGFNQGHREDLTGGGLIRSLGGWSEVRKHGSKSESHMMSDERILGDSEFVDTVLTDAGESYERRCELKAKGYDLDRIAERVAELYDMETREVFTKGRQKRKVLARSLLCYWAVRELGLPLRDLGRKLGMSGPGVGYAVERGELIVEENGFDLIPV